MARMIAVPKDDTTLSMLNMAEVGVSASARKKQIKKLKTARKKTQKKSSQSKRISESVRALAADNLAEPIQRSKLTGIMVLDGDLQNLDKIIATMPDYDIIEDVPLSLVRPIKSGIKLSQEQRNDIDTWHLESVQVMRARQSGFSGTGKGVGVAILDTGIEDVPEIKGRVKSAFEFDVETQDVVSIDTRDTDGHGTHVAGLIAGRHVGVAPGAELMNYIMIPGGFGSLVDFTNALDFVAGRPEVSIMNMSAGLPGYDDRMQPQIRTLRAFGVLPVAAAARATMSKSFLLEPRPRWTRWRISVAARRSHRTIKATRSRTWWPPAKPLCPV